jgi:hypothetical protein
VFYRFRLSIPAHARSKKIRVSELFSRKVLLRVPMLDFHRTFDRMYLLHAVTTDATLL